MQQDHLEAKHSFKKIFGNKAGSLVMPSRRAVQPHSVYTCGSSVPPRDLGPLLLIHDASLLSAPLIDLPIEDIADMVLKTCDDWANDRAKALLAIVRGMGGGKTRALEELRRSLLRENVLPLAITFNSSMNFDPNEIKLCRTAEHSFAVSVLVRLTISLYGISQDTVRRKYLKAFCNLAHKHTAVDLIRGFLWHAAEKIRKARNQPKHAKIRLVVLVDEAVKVEAAFQEDILRVLRDAVLGNTSTQFLIGPGITSTMVVSSLLLLPVLKTSSGRKIVPIVLPATLDCDRVLHEWWMPDKSSVVDYALKLAHLKFVAIALNGLPRCLEEVNTFLIEKKQAKFTVAFCTDLWKHVINSIAARYKRFTSPSHAAVSALVFGDPIRLNEHVMALIQGSDFTNSITDFDDEFQIVPEASIGMILSKKNWDQHIHLSLIEELFTNFLVKKNRADGDALEEFVFRWLIVRLEVACLSGETTMNLSRLLFGEHSTIPRAQDEVTMQTQTDIYSHFSLSPNVQYVHLSITNQLLPSIKSPDLFFKDIRKYESALTDRKVLLFRTAKGERFDVLLIVGDTNKCRVVFIDAKSSQEPPTSSNRDADNFELPNHHQYQSVVDLMDAAKHWNQQSDYASCFSAALAAGNFVFVFMCTHTGASFLKQRAVVLRRNELQSFFGPLWHFYVAVRSIPLR